MYPLGRLEYIVMCFVNISWAAENHTHNSAEEAELKLQG